MKTSHIVGISAGAVVGALLIGGTGFAIGMNAGDRFGAHGEARAMLQQQADQDTLAEGYRQGPGRGERGPGHRPEGFGERSADMHDESGEGPRARHDESRETATPDTTLPTDTPPSAIEDPTTTEESPLP